MSNCIIFALVRWFNHGGYIIVRRSHHGWWPHFMWVASLGELEIEEYIPPKTINLADRLQIPPLIFRGSIRRGKDRAK